MSLASVTRERRELPLGLIDPPAKASRETMDEAKLDELTTSIHVHGLIQELVVVRTGERYEVVAGHRRLIACQRAGLVVAPCAIYPTVEDALEGIKFAENRFREDLNAAEEAIWFSELLEQQCGGDVDRLCVLLGEKRAYVEGRLLLFHGDPVVFDALRAGRIKIGVAHQLNRCTDDLQRRSFLHAVIVGGATAAVVSGWIQQWERDQAAIAGTAPPAASSPVPAAVAEFDYFRCYVCGGTDHVHTMNPVNIHQHCRLAILDPLLKTYRGDEDPTPIAKDPRRI